MKNFFNLVQIYFRVQFHWKTLFNKTIVRYKVRTKKLDFIIYVTSLFKEGIPNSCKKLKLNSG